MQVRLRVQSGSHEGKEIEVSEKRFLIGRSESCQLRPKSESVSRRHCILALKDGRVLVQDLKSRNGTYVNEKRLPADKAKVLKDGDQLRIGRLMFTLVIEHGLNAAKKPEVKNVADAAARVKEGGSEDSRFEDVDVDSWLDEADAIDRVRKQTDPDTRQFRLDGKDGDKSDDLSVDGTVMIEDAVKKPKADNDTRMSSDDDTSTGSRVIPPKGKPGKLPASAKKALKENSRDAADDALKRFFSGR
ncbi:FHA domain-containing protein [Rhodopirellula halodulae]|uniref:FHA domain-containing protein n=1 Tax=Rhodopirellula halodulae TaxID=2894198 RepID=UPI001E519771|nr:FHA domain-containing protein [Rhodopirellula sp. JC737]MCC9655456.1 FHA domain-containing protein [Rhodopirellula sp. JC737]